MIRYQYDCAQCHRETILSHVDVSLNALRCPCGSIKQLSDEDVTSFVYDYFGDSGLRLKEGSVIVKGEYYTDVIVKASIIDGKAIYEDEDGSLFDSLGKNLDPHGPNIELILSENRDDYSWMRQAHSDYLAALKSFRGSNYTVELVRVEKSLPYKIQNSSLYGKTDKPYTPFTVGLVRHALNVAVATWKDNHSEADVNIDKLDVTKIVNDFLLKSYEEGNPS